MKRRCKSSLMLLGHFGAMRNREIPGPYVMDLITDSDKRAMRRSGFPAGLLVVGCALTLRPRRQEQIRRKRRA